MDSVQIIFDAFPGLTSEQKIQFEKIGPLYADWNAKINVISRKDIDNFYLHHALHSLALARFITPNDGTAFLDMGTGGGFPGIPLAIMWPHCHFHLVDRIGKKIRVAREIAEEIGLKNVTFQHGDIGECRQKFDFVVSRAVMALDELVPLITKNISPKDCNKWPNGLLCLKGGDLTAEIKACRRPIVDVPLSDYFPQPFFETKQLIYVEL